MLGAVLKGSWRDDAGARYKRTEKRWPWRIAVQQVILKHHPRFPMRTFERRWNMVNIALEALRDDDAAPFGVNEMATLIVGFPDEAAARRIAKRYFAPYDHFFSWLDAD